MHHASQAAIDAVADMPPNEWAGWIVYFCEGIEAQEPDANVDLWLADAVEAIIALATGE